ncbi:PO113 protein, partial [Prunella himalayana]|nr:PO113 protein [Prunella himalayana]
KWSWIAKPLREEKPIPNAVTAYTDAGKRSRKAAIVWMQDGCWHQQLLNAMPEDSLQTLELLAVVWAVSNFPGPLNIVSDSLYVVGVVSRIEDAIIKEVQNRRLYELFL